VLPLALFLLGCLALLWALVVAWTAWTLTHPPRRTFASAVARGLPAEPGDLHPTRHCERWSFRDPLGRDLPAWDMRGGDAAGPVVVMAHGWGDSKIGGLLRVEALAPLASRLILWDFPGHGEAPGWCSLGPREAMTLQALARELTRGDRGTEANHPGIVLYGWSLGAVACIESGAAGLPGLLLVMAESPYRARGTPARNVLRAKGLPHRLTLTPALALVALFGREKRRGFFGFDCAVAAARSCVPICILNGSEDVVSPPEDASSIANECGQVLSIPGAGHNDLWTNPSFAETAARWARDCLGKVARSAK
jgi:pimeloyl-ACP methyl ester carboxylesterase